MMPIQINPWADQPPRPRRYGRARNLAERNCRIAQAVLIHQWRINRAALRFKLEHNTTSTICLYQAHTSLGGDYLTIRQARQAVSDALAEAIVPDAQQRAAA